MKAPHNTHIVELDRYSSEKGSPFGIITADCSSPREIDDGIFVEELDADQETYRVGVCVADTSKLHDDRAVFAQAMSRTAAHYYDLPDGERGYDPMIDPELIKDLEFSAGHNRSALIVSFVIGAEQPPSDLEVSFGRVEVTRNHNYKEFGALCLEDRRHRKFGRASAFIINHLKYVTGGDTDEGFELDVTAGPDAIYNKLMNTSPHQAWLRGSRLNEAYMVGANHLVGKMMDEEGRPAIYRVHDPEDERYLEFIPPTLATYSRHAGIHNGLNLNPYCRVTSPLRRLEDFIMSRQLKLRDKGWPVTVRDEREVAAAVQQLNRKIASDVLRGPLRITDLDVFGSHGRPDRRLAIVPEREAAV